MKREKKEKEERRGEGREEKRRGEKKGSYRSQVKRVRTGN